MNLPVIMINSKKMKTKTKLILIVSLILIAIGLLSLLINSNNEDYFNPIELSLNNYVTNNGLPKYLDTIITVSLDVANVQGINLVLDKISSEAQNQFSGGDLKAHMRYAYNHFYLFTDDYGRDESIEIFSHEVIHVQQYFSNDLVYDGVKVYWKGEEFDLNEIEYSDRPWEKEAFEKQGEISKQVKNILY